MQRVNRKSCVERRDNSDYFTNTPNVSRCKLMFKVLHHQKYQWEYLYYYYLNSYLVFIPSANRNTHFQSFSQRSTSLLIKVRVTLLSFFDYFLSFFFFVFFSLSYLIQKARPWHCVQKVFRNKINWIKSSSFLPYKAFGDNFKSLAFYTCYGVFNAII